MKILFVEDNPIDAKLVTRQLASLTLEFEVTVVQSLTEMSAQLDRGFDVILADLNLPDSRGIDTITSIKTAAPNVALVAFTGLDETKGMEALRLGAEDYAPKDCGPKALARICRYAYERQQIKNELRRAQRSLRKQRDQVEEQNISLSIKNAELESSAMYQRQLLERLGNRDDGLLAEIMRLESAPSGAKLDRLMEQARTVAKLSEHLGGDTKLSVPGNASALDDRVVGMAFSAKRAAKLVRRVLRSTGAELVELPDEIPQGKTLDALFVDWSSAETTSRTIEQYPGTHLVLVTEEQIFAERGLEILRFPFTAIVITDLVDRVKNNDPHAVRELLTVGAKLLGNDIFGLDKYLGWGASIHREILTTSRDRHDLIERITGLARECGLGNQRATRFATLADELISNAIWNAPVDKEGNPKYASLSRRDPVDLLEQEVVTVEYGSDGTGLGLAVTDNFGRLQHETTFKYLTKHFAPGGAEFDTTPGGAGLGITTSFDAASLIAINVAPNLKTEVIGFVKLRDKKPARSFSYFRVP